MKRLGLFMLLHGFCNSFNAQTAEYFHFSAPGEKVRGSLYNAIHFIDSRADTSNLGHVYGGPADRRLQVLPKIDLYAQCNWLLQHLTDSSAKNNELIFQLRKLEFNEEPGVLYPQEGFCTLRADLYCKRNNSCFRLARLDTLIQAGGEEVTPLLFEATTNAIAQLLKNSIVKYEDHTLPYLYHEVLRMDSMDRSSSELFVRDALTDGVYLTFEAFRTQSPELSIVSARSVFGEIRSVKASDKKYNTSVIFPGEAYAVVYGGKAYVARKSRFYALKKEQDDFYFIAELKNPPKDLGMKLSAGTAILIGTDRPELQRRLNGPPTGLYKIRIDPVDGSFITVNKIIQ